MTTTSPNPEVIDASRMSPAMRGYYTRKANRYSGLVKYIDAWGLSVKQLKAKCVDGKVWQASTGTNHGKPAHIILI